MNTKCAQNLVCAHFLLFLTIIMLANSYFMGYLPQHCLYFFPLPQGPLYSGFWDLLGALGSLIRHLVALGSTP